MNPTLFVQGIILIAAGIFCLFTGIRGLKKLFIDGKEGFKIESSFATIQCICLACAGLIALLFVLTFASAMFGE